MVSRRCSSAFVPACAVALLCLNGACRHEDDDLGLRQDDSRPVALDQLTDPAGLLVALGQPGVAFDGALGGRGFDVTRTLELSANGASDLVEETVRFDTNGKGAVALRHDLSHPRTLAPAPPRGEGADAVRDKVDPSAQGMEAVAVDGKLYVRPRYGRFVERRPEAEELEHLREIGEQLLHDDLELLLPAVAISAAGEGSALGRPTRKLTLTRAASPRTPPADEDPRRAWRASVRVTELSGELALDAATGAPRSARLDARYEFVRSGKTLGAHLTFTLGSRASAAINAPGDAIASPRRPRPTTERNALLDGLAPLTGTSAGRTP